MVNKKKVNNNATIKDVAKMANVSISTVSRVVNRKEGVSEELETKIKNAIEKLKYKPNTIARALKNNTTKSIGLIVPSIENAIFPQLIRVIEDTARKYGFSTILCNSEGDVEAEARHLELLVEKQVDGILFDAMGIYNKNFEVVNDTNTPILILGKKIENFDVPNIEVDNFIGAYQAVDYMVKSGNSKVVFMFGQLESDSAISSRFGGYKAALRDNQIPYLEELVVKGTWSFEGGIVATDELLSRGIKFDSVFASNDMIAIGCMERLLQIGYKIPEDVCIMGYDDIPIASIIRPHLSTVRTPIKDFGIESVKTILRIIFTKNDNISTKIFKPDIIIRNSTKSRK